MIVTTLESVIGTPDHVSGQGWQSRRLLLHRHGLGYSFHDTIIEEGTEQHLQYKNHIEANYCIEGEGEVVDVATGATYPVTPGTVYVLDKHDAHILRALRGRLRLLCIFAPALIGHESHDADGSYAPPSDSAT
ncbi:ectoine synthase [Rhodoligotrophos defluvii]|uniref:ectoine synthase n=1 Tax=Rhodoligotrophos defluvii TaxID=2561934 RepID=UPI0010C9F8DC|nr:ectoine synthase [Rhodoligotrophos defluvii]